MTVFRLCKQLTGIKGLKKMIMYAPDTQAQNCYPSTRQKDVFPLEYLAS